MWHFHLFQYCILMIVTQNFCCTQFAESDTRTVAQDPNNPKQGIENIRWNSPLDLKKLKSEPIAGFDYSNQELEKLKLWKDGIIPYYIDTFSFDKVLRDRIRSFLEKVSVQTGVQFLELPIPPEDAKTRWVLFINRVGRLQCVDYTSGNLTNEGVQRVVLGYDCVGYKKDSALAATVLALAGVPPQHNAPDRDHHVKVYIDNVLPDKKHLFQALSNNEWLFHELPYDFTSAGHFGFFKYSRNGSKTIFPKKRVGKIRVGKGLSIIDQIKLKMLYSYITKKKLNHMTASCSKMFRPTENLNRIPNTKNQLLLKPRKKPDKYTGIKTDETGPGPVTSSESKHKEKLSHKGSQVHAESVTPTYQLPKSGTILGTITSNKLSNLTDYMSSDTSY